MKIKHNWPVSNNQMSKPISEWDRAFWISVYFTWETEKDTFYHLDCKSCDKAGGPALNRGLPVLAWKIFLGVWSNFRQKTENVGGLHILFYFKSKQTRNSSVFGQNFSQRTLPLVALPNFLSIRDTSFSHFCLGANIRLRRQTWVEINYERAFLF